MSEYVMVDVEELAQIIREVDGNHSLGAGALAEAIVGKLAATAPREPVVYACPECGTGMEVDPSAKPARREPSLDSQRKVAAETLVERFLFERDDSISDAERTDHERSESAKLIVKQVTELLQVAPREPAPVVGDAENALRDALAYVGYRNDGDLKVLAERAELWMRESRVLIDMLKKLTPPAPPVGDDLAEQFRLGYEAGQRAKATPVDELIRAGQMLSNCAYNLKQTDRLTERERDSLDRSDKAWQAAIQARRQQGGE